MGIPFELRSAPLSRPEPIIADEIAFVGTLNEITLISEFDGEQAGGPTRAETHRRALSSALYRAWSRVLAVDMQCRSYVGKEPILRSAAV